MDVVRCCVLFREMRYMNPVNLFQEVACKESAAMPKRGGRLLGLDVGGKYVGLAVSDPNNKVASPLSVLLRKKTNIDLMASDFQLLTSQLSLHGFVVGYPFANHLSPNPNAVQVNLFMDDLCDTGKLEGLSYTYWNESYTSKNVEMLLKPLDLHPVHYKTVVDKFAAVGILQGYLDYVNNKGR